MNALSMWQPWASLVAHRFKQWETRSWDFPEKHLDKPMAIHAAKRPMDKDALWLRDMILCSEGLPVGPDLKRDLTTPPFGEIVCIVIPRECVQTRYATLNNIIKWDPEFRFGDFSDGRFCTRLELIERFEPGSFQVRGRQSFFNWDKSNG